MLRKVVPVQVNALGDDEVEVIISTAALARDGHVLVPQGARLDNYRANPIVLWQHDPEHPVGNAEEVTIAPDKISARIRFAPLGIAKKADEVRGLVKSSVVRALSIGFDAIDGEPLNVSKPRGGQRITDWELFEISFVSVPADTGAVVTARAHGDSDMADWKVGASRELAIEDSDSWDGGEAASSIFEWAGGDDFDPKKARSGFLVYDADAPKKRGSYKLPIARAKDGKLVVPKGAIRAAASRLPQTDIPDDVKERAQKVVDHYKAEAKIGDTGENEGRGLKQILKRARPLSGVNVQKRGLYDVANLAYYLEQLGWIKNCADFEQALEGDDSKVPGMLGEALVQLGEALIEMTSEEVNELLDGHDLEIAPDDEVVLDVEKRAHIAAGKTPRIRAWRRSIALIKFRAGKTLSKDTVDCLRSALAAHEEGMDYHRSAMRSHKRAAKEIRDLMDRSGVPGHEETGEDSDVQNVQSSDGKNEDDEGARSADFRRRQAELLQLTP